MASRGVRYVLCNTRIAQYIFFGNSKRNGTRPQAKRGVLSGGYKRRQIEFAKIRQKRERIIIAVMVRIYMGRKRPMCHFQLVEVSLAMRSADGCVIGVPGWPGICHPKPPMPPVGRGSRSDRQHAAKFTLLLGQNRQSVLCHRDAPGANLRQEHSYRSLDLSLGQDWSSKTACHEIEPPHNSGNPYLR